MPPIADIELGLRRGDTIGHRAGKLNADFRRAVVVPVGDEESTVSLDLRCVHPRVTVRGFQHRVELQVRASGQGGGWQTIDRVGEGERVSYFTSSAGRVRGEEPVLKIDHGAIGEESGSRYLADLLNRETEWEQAA